jgi:hypothetical protein
MIQRYEEVMLMRVEVFKTNVVDREVADQLIQHIQNSVAHYTASFDLDDCDRILVVRSTRGEVQSLQIIELLNKYDCHAEVLEG